MPAGNIFEGAKEPAIGRYACRPELRFYQEGVDDGAIGLVPGAHDSTSIADTSGATARKTSGARWGSVWVVSVDRCTRREERRVGQGCTGTCMSWRWRVRL